MRERSRFERELSHLGFPGLREFDAIPTPSDIDEAAAQPPFAKDVRNRLLRFLSAAELTKAVASNKAFHPKGSGIPLATVGKRLEQYVYRAAIEQAMAGAGAEAVITEMTHQFQQKVYAEPGHHDGVAGEGTLDALGF